MLLCPNWLHWMRCTNSYIVSPGNLTFPLTILRLLLLPWSTLKTFRRPGEDTPMAFIIMYSAERSYFMIYLCFLKWRARGYRAVFGRTSVQGTWWTTAPKNDTTLSCGGRECIAIDRLGPPFLGPRLCLSSSAHRGNWKRGPCPLGGQNLLTVRMIGQLDISFPVFQGTSGVGVIIYTLFIVFWCGKLRSLSAEKLC